MLDDDDSDVEDDEFVFVDDDIDDKIVVDDDDIKTSKLSDPWQFRNQDFKVLLPTTVHIGRYDDDNNSVDKDDILSANDL